MRVLRGIRRKYGVNPNISEERYVRSVVEPALHSHQRGNMDFRTAYSNQDRALFRDEEIEMNRRGIKEGAQREQFQLEFRRGRNIAFLSDRLGDRATERYDSLVQAWVDKNLETVIELNRAFARDGLAEPRTKDELRRDLELDYHSAVLIKTGIPWRQFLSVDK